MTITKKAICLLTAACLFSSGCYVRLGYRTKLVKTEEQRRPISTAGEINGVVQESPPGVALLRLTRTQQEEVSTVEMYQRVQRRFDLTGLALATGGVCFVLFIVLIIAAANSDGSGGGSHSWDDWD